MLASGALPAMAETSGSWRIEEVATPTYQGREIQLLRSPTGNQGTSFALACLPDTSVYAFVLRDASLARFARAEEAAIRVRVAVGEVVGFTGTARGDGSVILQEKVHQTPFSLILAALKQAKDGSAEISIADHQWAFALDGFVEALPKLAERCGFEPAIGTGPGPRVRGPGQPPRPEPPLPEVPRPEPPLPAPEPAR
jgi:hypothetical protein